MSDRPVSCCICERLIGYVTESLLEAPPTITCPECVEPTPDTTYPDCDRCHGPTDDNARYVDRRFDGELWCADCLESPWTG